MKGWRDNWLANSRDADGAAREVSYAAAAPAMPPVPTTDVRLAALTRLLEASAPVDVARAIVQMVQTLGYGPATLWWCSGPGMELETTTDVPPGAADLRRIRAMEEAHAPFVVEGTCLWLRLSPHDRALLQLPLRSGQRPEPLVAALEPCLAPAASHLRRALKLAQLYDSHKQLERSETLQRALFAISDLAGSELDMPEMLRGIHEIVSTLMYSENFFIVRCDPIRHTMRFLYYVDAEDTDAPDTTREVPLDEWRNTLTWHLITGGKALMGSHEQLRQQVHGEMLISGPASIDWLGVPMLRDGQTYGALVVQSYQPGIGFSGEDRAVLAFVANHILTALERKQSKDELEQRVRLRTLELAQANRGLQLEVLERQRAERLQAALFHIAQLATADIDETEFYQRTHAVVGELINVENFFIALLSDDRNSLVFPYFVDGGVRSNAGRPLGRGLSEYVLRHGQPLLASSEQIHALKHSGEIELVGLGHPCICWLGVPLRFGDDVIGVVVVQSYDEAVDYDLADQELLSFAALQIANSIQRRRSAVSLQRAYAELEQRVEERTRELRTQILQREKVQQQLKHQVMHDALTGLPNRGFLRDRLDRVLGLLKRESGRRCALLYLDMDRFKVINDSLGHLAGDDYLKEMARRLLQCVRDPDVVARLSGDEFAILLEDVEIPATAVAVAQRVLATIGQPFQLGGRELQPSASMGIAVGDNTYASADELLRDADIALYRAKQQGRNRFEMFDETLAKNVVDVLTMEGELRHALAHEELEPYLQPVCRLGSGEIVGYEALLRWNHPTRGLLAPGDFIRIAEDGGLIETIDWRMFELSCQRLLQLPDRKTYLTINVSALHLRYTDFDQRLVRLLESTGLPPQRLIVEVTEGALLDNPDLVREMLDRLRSRGVGAALDDFGTGYSSLSYLHSLPLRVLKIDRAFVQALDGGPHDSATVVAAILALASALNIQVIAEGIETPGQRDALLAMGCEFGQGYLLGRPAPVEHWL